MVFKDFWFSVFGTEFYCYNRRSSMALYLSTSIATLIAPPAPDSANSNASLDLAKGNLCVIKGFTLTAPTMD